MSELETTFKKTVDQGEFIKTELRKYLRYWIWFVIGIVVALGVAFLYLRYTPKVYKSTAKIKILNKTKGLELPSAAFVFNRSNINLENEIEILKSYRIIEEVVKRIDLTSRFYYEGSVVTTEVDRLPFGFLKKVDNRNSYKAGSYTIRVKANAFEVVVGKQSDVLVFPNFDTTKVTHRLPFELSRPKKSKGLEQLQDKTYIVKFVPVSGVTKGLKGTIAINGVGKGSDLLKLSYTSQSKVKNERIINTLIEVFNDDGINDRQEISRRTIDFIDERFLLLSEELDSIELGIRDFKQKNDLIDVSSDAQLSLTQRTSSEEALFNVENQLILADLLGDTLNNTNADSDLLPAGLTNVSINRLVDNYNTLVFERDNLITSAGENNPSVVLVNQKLEAIKANIDVSIASYKTELEASKQQLENKNRQYTSQVYGLPAKEKIILEIQRQQAIKQTLYLFLLQKREEAAINMAITVPSIKVVEYAISNGGPVSPVPRSIYLMALFGGLLVPFIFVYVIHLLDTKVKGSEDVKQYNPQIPIVGELPRVKQADLIFSDPEDNSVQAEAFRILSSNVNYILPVKANDGGKVIYSTSTIKGEGKTYVSINLSLALSSINRKVLLIGADLRNPQIHTHIKQEKHKP
jgi:uncharacterized protein involved in exopolysaccharide biosynthesis